MTEQHIRTPNRPGVIDAAARIAAILPETPLMPVEHQGVQFWAKAECLQPVGAFKIRGAWNRLSRLSAEEKARGVVAVSSGNHAQGVAWTAKRLRIAATIVMPSDAPRVKVDNVHALGAQIVFYERLTENREEIAGRLCEASNATYVHAYGDPWVIEGQGSAGIEICAQLSQRGLEGPSQILACCGGGGLSAGLTLACPGADIFTVEPEGWDDVARSLAAGEIQPIGPNPPPTACDALQTLSTWPINFAVLKAHGVRGLSVSEREVREAQRFAFAHLRLVLEPGGAVALAAALSGKVPLDSGTVIMLTGGNVDPAAFARVISSSD